ncbi:uncharacterized protein LOC126992299 [Eriocheir sinensis]|uniref:uncharacterized protein LOC126992299 n=1 Tax=Eriocheir sinensis TaxID=95602 RepID=UPI0021C8E202|nr:uncharacterized protein LOC126992299 [Eriocheir sinensis]
MSAVAPLEAVSLDTPKRKADRSPEDHKPPRKRFLENDDLPLLSDPESSDQELDQSSTSADPEFVTQEKRKTVQQRKRQQTRAVEVAPAPREADRRRPTEGPPRYRLVHRGDCTSDYLAVRHLETLRRPAPAVHLQTPTPFLLTPRDAAAAEFLEEVVARRPRGIVLQRLDQAPRRVKGVLVGYPLEYDAEDIRKLTDSGVTHVRRCHVVREGRRLPTRNVELVMDRESLPKDLSLGWLGRYRVRPFVEEPTRCFKCQKFGHVARLCRGSRLTCAVCAGNHDSIVCIGARREEASRPPPRCCNCGGSHPAWSRRCAERRRRLPTTERGPVPQPRGHGQTEMTAPPRPPPPTEEDYPPLPAQQPLRPGSAPRRRRNRNKKKRRPATTAEGPTPAPVERRTPTETEHLSSAGAETRASSGTEAAPPLSRSRRMSAPGRLDAGLLKTFWISPDSTRKATVTYRPTAPTFDLHDLMVRLQAVMARMHCDLLQALGAHRTSATDAVLKRAETDLLTLTPGTPRKTRPTTNSVDEENPMLEDFRAAQA